MQDLPASGAAVFARLLLRKSPHTNCTYLVPKIRDCISNEVENAREDEGEMDAASTYKLPRSEGQREITMQHCNDG